MTFETLTDADKKRCLHMLDESAREDIEAFCSRGIYDNTEASGIVLWLDISQVPECPAEKRIVQNAILWCKKRGLLTHHRKHPEQVRFHSVAREQYQAPTSDTSQNE